MDLCCLLYTSETAAEPVYTFSVEERIFYAIPFNTLDDEEKETWAILILSKDNQRAKRKTIEHDDLSKHFKEILEGSFDGILVTDKEGKVLFVNSSYERVAEIKKSEIEGKYMRDLINPIWMPESVAHIVAKEQTVVSKRQVVKSGRHIMVTGRPIFNNNGGIKMIVINARDITEIYKMCIRDSACTALCTWKARKLIFLRNAMAAAFAGPCALARQLQWNVSNVK